MPVWGEIIVGLVIAVGLVGTIVQVLPGGTVVGAAVAVWGLVERGQVGWTVFGFAVALTVAGWVLQYLIPGRYMKQKGVATSTLLIGAVCAVVGFFVIPVVGLIIGFLGGVFVAELARSKDASVAWPATVCALKAAGLSILVELSVALLIATAWVIGLVLT